MQESIGPKIAPAADQDLGACLQRVLGLTHTPKFALGYNNQKFEDEADIVKLARTLTFSAAGGLAGTMAAGAANARYQYTAEVGLVCLDGEQVHGIEFGRLPVLESENGFKSPEHSILTEILKQGAHQHYSGKIDDVDGSYYDDPGNAAVLFKTGSIFLFPFSTQDRNDLVNFANRIGERELQHSLSPDRFADVVLSQARNPPEDLGAMAQDPEYREALEMRFMLSETSEQIAKLTRVRDYCPEAYAVIYRAIERDRTDYPMVVLSFVLFPVALGFLLLSGWEILGDEFEFVVIAVFLVALVVAYVSYAMVSAFLEFRKRDREFKYLQPPE